MRSSGFKLWDPNYGTRRQTRFRGNLQKVREWLGPVLEKEDLRTGWLLVGWLGTLSVLNIVRSLSELFNDSTKRTGCAIAPGEYDITVLSHEIIARSPNITEQEDMGNASALAKM